MKVSSLFSFVLALTIGIILMSSFVLECDAKKNHGSKRNGKNFRRRRPKNGHGPHPFKPHGLQVGFYNGLCPNIGDVDAFIETLVRDEFLKDPTILPAMLRMQFHDCFVNGCDASILIGGTTTEKNAGANLSVRGFEFIDAIKAALQARCPDVVSCADVIAIATKVLIKLGGGPDYPVETGRRDGLRSNVNDVNLPDPFMSVSQIISMFAAKGFNTQEMVLLLGGGHTVGVAHCEFFQTRVHNDNSQFDPTMDPNFRNQLMRTCPSGTTTNNKAFLDQNPMSSSKVDNSFYDQILKNKGLLQIDQSIAHDSQTSDMVSQLASNPNLFNNNFAKAMVKLQALDVLVGNQGNIRTVCSKFN